jgi:hypothetical protein
MQIHPIQNLIRLEVHHLPSWREALLSSNESFKALVTDKYKNSYGLEIAGKRITMPSLIPLYKGEELLIKKTHVEHELEILKRSYTELESNLELHTKRKSISELLSHSIESSEIIENRIYQTLNSYFPTLHFRADTPYFDWVFDKGEGSGYFFKKENYSVFYIEFNFKKLGYLEIYLQYQKKDFSDLVINIFIEKIESYSIILGSLEHLKEKLKKLDFETFHINLFYESESKDRSWVA